MTKCIELTADLPGTPLLAGDTAKVLLHLRLQHDPAWRTDTARRIDDKNPANWTTLEDWKQEFAAGGDKG
jgi:hypothetical protein